MQRDIITYEPKQLRKLMVTEMWNAKEKLYCSEHIEIKLNAEACDMNISKRSALKLIKLIKSMRIFKKDTKNINKGIVWKFAMHL